MIDNSDSPNVSLLNELISKPKVKYIDNKNNLGVAYALNQAASLAKKEEYHYLLTMDQDSNADSKLLENYENFLNSNDQNHIGMLAPIPKYLPERRKENMPLTKEVDVAITSGCLLNLNSYEETGPFMEKLFIDYVDFEYCLRLKKNGFKIIQLGKAKIYHQLGQLQKRKFIYKTIYVTNHLPIRYYYRTRNRFYVAKKYITSFPLFVLKDFFIFINELVKIIIYEKMKLLKYKMILSGLVDYYKNNYGNKIFS